MVRFIARQSDGLPMPFQKSEMANRVALNPSLVFMGIARRGSTVFEAELYSLMWLIGAAG
jgi:hypothetical protein